MLYELVEVRFVAVGRKGVEDTSLVGLGDTDKTQVEDTGAGNHDAFSTDVRFAEDDVFPIRHLDPDPTVLQRIVRYDARERTVDVGMHREYVDTKGTCTLRAHNRVESDVVEIVTENGRRINFE